MTITLISGLVVDQRQYYMLLDWKDKNPGDFDVFIDDYGTSRSINNMTQRQYNQLVAFAKNSKPSWNFNAFKS